MNVVVWLLLLCHCCDEVLWNTGSPNPFFQIILWIFNPQSLFVALPGVWGWKAIHQLCKTVNTLWPPPLSQLWSPVCEFVCVWGQTSWMDVLVWSIKGYLHIPFPNLNKTHNFIFFSLNYFTILSYLCVPISVISSITIKLFAHLGAISFTAHRGRPSSIYRSGGAQGEYL